jgi:hypothetical protein
VDTATDTITANGPVAASFTITISAVPATTGYTTSTITLDASGSTNAASYAWDLDNNGSTDRTGVTVTDTIANLFPVSSPNSAPFREAFTIKMTATGAGGSSQELQSFTSVAASSTLALSASQDGTIYGESGATGNGAGGAGDFVAGRAYNPSIPANGGVRRALVEFDVSSLLSGSTILGAALTLECTMSASSGSQSFALRRVTTGWNEGTTTAGLAGQGSTAIGNDVTWDEASAGVTNWTLDGGDFSATASSNVSVDATGSYTWPTSSTMASNVQLWLDTPANNHGWLLQASETSATRTVKWFASRSNATAGDRPSLAVTFRRPL